jgi:hypothetical protein
MAGMAQFSIKRLMASVVLVAIGSAWLAYAIRSIAARESPPFPGLVFQQFAIFGAWSGGGLGLLLGRPIAGAVVDSIVGLFFTIEFYRLFG